MAIAAIAFDRFHVIQVANKAVDWVRQGKARGEGLLKKTRWAWLKDQSKYTAKEHEKMAWLHHTQLKTAQARPDQGSFDKKEALRDSHAPKANAQDIAQAHKRSLHWAERSRLHVMKDLASAIKSHWLGFLITGKLTHLPGNPLMQTQVKTTPLG